MTSSNRDLAVRSLRGSGSLWEVVSETLDLPKPTLMGILGANPYGIDLGKLVALRDTLVPEKVMHLTLRDIVGGAISDDESVRARYLEWIDKAKKELGALTTVGKARAEEAVKSASALRKELASARRAIKRPSVLTDELKAVGKRLEEKAKTATSIRLKINKGKKAESIKADSTPISEILSELLGRLGITDHVAYISALGRLAEETRSVSKGQKSSGANSLGELAAQTTSGPSLISLLSKGMYLVRNAVSSKAIGGSSEGHTTVMGVIVCDAAGEHPEGPSFGRRYVIHTGHMTLERGPGFRLDAFDVLDKFLATFEIATTNLLKDKDHSRAYVTTLLDALAEAFKMPASHKSHSNSKKGGGTSVVKITTTTGGCAMCAEDHVAKLEKLGIVQKGGRDEIVYVQQVPTAEQQRMNEQHLRNDGYVSSCFGLFVGIQCCELCMECSDYLGDE